MTEDEKLDRFMRGLQAPFLEIVLMADVTTFADAYPTAERVAAVIS